MSVDAMVEFEMGKDNTTDALMSLWDSFPSYCTGRTFLRQASGAGAIAKTQKAMDAYTMA